MSKIEELKTKIVDLRGEIKMLFDSMEIDFAKTLNDVAQSHSRVRTGLKLISVKSLELRKALIEHKHEIDANRKAAREAKKSAK